MFVRIHNVHFYNLEPKSVSGFAYEPKGKKLALLRNDHTIEVWNIGNAPFIELTIHGQVNNPIEAILWVREKLFSCGQRGMIAEYDLYSLKIKYEAVVTGGPAWCMDVNHNQTRLAVGTEDGYINTFFVTEENLLYEKIFDKQKGRILCIKWDNTGEMIYSGSADTVRVWNAANGHAIHRMLTGRKELKKETIVWCLAVTKDNMIVSGDSRGTLSIWDPNLGSLINSFDSHAADILAVTLSHDKNVIYCAGVDPVIRTFSKIANKSNGNMEWHRNIERRIHIHDVRALIEIKGKLYSAGVDGHLAYSSYPPKTLVKYPPLLQPPCVYVCSKSKCILLRYHNYLEIWKLGTISKTTDVVHPGEFHQLEKKPLKILHVKTKLNENIISCAITKDSRLIIYSTERYLRVLNFNIVEGKATLCKQKTDVPNKRIQKMLFSLDSELFITANNDGNGNIITVYTVSTEYDICFLGSFTTSKEEIKIIRLMCLSPDNKYLICSDTKNHIAIYNIQDNWSSESVKAWLLPKHNCPPTAMAVQKSTNHLIIVYSDHKIIEYSITKKKYTKFSNNLQSHLPAQWLARSFPITNIMFDKNNDDIIILHDDTTVFIINKLNDLLHTSTKISKLENGNCKEESSTCSSLSSQHTIQVVKKYKHLVYLDWLKNKEIVAVEVTPTSLIEKLPPTLKQKWFGI